jgi:membrane protein DedA with SNARE-associated domain
LAGFLGDQFYFFLGRYKGARILQRFPHAQARAHKFDDLLSRWHAPLIIGIRFMYGFRVVGPIMLGMGRVEAWKFVVYNFIGAAIWAPLIAGLGYLFGSILESVLGDLKRVELWAFVAMIAIGLAFFFLHWLRARREDRRAPVQL